MATCTQTKAAIQPSVALTTIDSSSRQSLEYSNANQSTDSDDEAPRMSLLRKLAVIIQLSGVNFASSAVNGLVVVGLPTITADLKLDPSLAFWPTSVSSLANASTILLAGSVADSIGPRPVNLAGGLVTGAFILAAGASKTGPQLIVMRALQGIGYAMHLVSQPLGFSFGLVLGGILQDLIGWRAAWYIYGGLTLALSVVAAWALPNFQNEGTFKGAMRNLKVRVDWVGALLASVFMTLLSYLFAAISVDLNRIRDPKSIVFICLIAMALPLFVVWVHRQVKLGKPALIPNALWKDTAFSSICGTVALSFGVTTAMELFASLFFQEVQHLSPLQTGLRIMPSLLVGVILNVTTGLFVHRVPALWIVTVSSIICSVAPLLMAVIKVQSPYWANAFIAQVLAPMSTDVLFTALTLGIMQIVSTLVTKDHSDKILPMARLEGLRASFWTMFGFMMLCTLWGAIGLRNTGRVGLKRD
ncbi:major facilitator superfamily domain-containing protein [Trichoderma breve]|uniref:Major facilitator superfamily domain-containing protein n=1 Tax=Trichoderma breve TaxID=2034170 RepID=A0A9W9JSV4_9HYPO|nr:major facilitator superfamily domain-containing protein [Trichoderma breve]KAJ4865651.1 major facilitator superfamily domain-containing protein [Trichoderma breve]